MADCSRLQYFDSTKTLRVVGTDHPLPVQGSGLNGGLSIQPGDNSGTDAFGRLRISQPYTLFDSKNIFDDPDIPASAENQPLFYDNVEVTGSGTSSTYSANRASTTLAVAANTFGRRVRQTKRRFNYQPGKSLLIFCTFVLGSIKAGITKREGYYDDNNGLFVECSDAFYIGVRSFATGTADDTKVAQANWNIDKLDGTGPSGKTIDFTKTQIFIIDMEWLGVGRVRTGFVIDGVINYTHEFLNTNNLDVVYMSSPNLPIRTEIINDGTGATDSIEQICSTVISEGGQEETGITRHYDSGQISASVAGTIYPVLGIKLKPSHLGATVSVQSISILAQTTDDLHWGIYINPSITGTLTYAGINNGAVSAASGNTAVMSGGYELEGGFVRGDSFFSLDLRNAIKLGSTVAGVSDEVVLGVTPLGANAIVRGAMNWREFV